MNGLFFCVPKIRLSKKAPFKLRPLGWSEALSADFYDMRVDKEEEVSRMLKEAKIFVSMFDEIVSNLSEEEIEVYRIKLKKAA